MRLLILTLSLLLAACATPYGKYGIAGGYTDTQIDENTFSVRVEANGFTSQETASRHAMYRAAELSAEKGFDYFVILGGGNGSTSGAIVMPSTATSRTTVTGYGNTAVARTTTTYSPTVAMPMVFPNSGLTFKAFKGPKPEDNPNAYDANSVMKYVGPQIGK